ncbi:hypothetical protein ACD661_07510 [Legionella lytica]|uniref:Uncharacterized protein n=1 Tax=Legionella lytica TaxID=96232 RepID=A0ABW8D6S1_9GAMM
MNYLKIVILMFTFMSWSNQLLAGSHMQMREESNYFQFMVPKHHTVRQAGQILNIYIRYAYKQDLPITEYPDYRLLRSIALNYMEPSVELPENVFWEIIAQQIGKDLMRHFPLVGISVQLEVLDNQNPDAYEPGDHGPIYTIGNIKPLDRHS